MHLEPCERHSALQAVPAATLAQAKALYSFKHKLVHHAAERLYVDSAAFLPHFPFCSDLTLLQCHYSCRWGGRLVGYVFVGGCGWRREPLGYEGMGHYFPMEQLLCRTRGISGVSNKGYICLTKAKLYSVFRVTQGTHGAHVNCLESRSLWLCRAQL